MVPEGVMLRDIISIIALFVGPVTVVLITLWWQQRKEKQERKVALFTALMVHRKVDPPTLEWANAVNMIDVVFADNVRVRNLWHELSDVLYTVNSPVQTRTHKYLELLSAMAISLGYKRLQQTDIDKFYIAQAHFDAAAKQAEMQSELLRILKNTEHFVTAPKKD